MRSNTRAFLNDARIKGLIDSRDSSQYNCFLNTKLFALCFLSLHQTLYNIGILTKAYVINHAFFLFFLFLPSSILFPSIADSFSLFLTSRWPPCIVVLPLNKCILNTRASVRIDLMPTTSDDSDSDKVCWFSGHRSYRSWNVCHDWLKYRIYLVGRHHNKIRLATDSQTIKSRSREQCKKTLFYNCNQSKDQVRIIDSLSSSSLSSDYWIIVCRRQSYSRCPVDVYHLQLDGRLIAG